MSLENKCCLNTIGEMTGMQRDVMVRNHMFSKNHSYLHQKSLKNCFEKNR